MTSELMNFGLVVFNSAYLIINLMTNFRNNRRSREIARENRILHWKREKLEEERARGSNDYRSDGEPGVG